MQKVTLIMLIVIAAQSSFGQDLSLYLFTRSPQLFNYNLRNSESSFNQGVSAGIGMTHQKLFLELGSYILEGNSYGYYSFFGSNLNSFELVHAVRLNTNLFGEITNVPAQGEQPKSSWIFTSGVCFFPNIQLERLNVGIPLCVGLAYQDESLYLNSRFILNLSYTIK